MGAKKSRTNTAAKRGKKVTKKLQDLPPDRGSKAVKGGAPGGFPTETIKFDYPKIVKSS